MSEHWEEGELFERFKYHLVRFDITREIFPIVTRVLSILLTTAAPSATSERVNSKERVSKVRCSIPAASYGPS